MEKIEIVKFYLDEILRILKFSLLARFHLALDRFRVLFDRSKIVFNVASLKVIRCALIPKLKDLKPRSEIDALLRFSIESNRAKLTQTDSFAIDSKLSTSPDFVSLLFDSLAVP